jgi:hypothetical protein
MPQNRIKIFFLVVPDHFLYKKGPIHSVRGLFSSLRIGTYIPPTCRPLSTFLGPFGCAQMPQNSTKTYFLVAPDHLFLKNRLNDMVWGLFLSLNNRIYILLTFGPLCTFLGPFWGSQMPQNSIEKTIFGLFHTISPTRMGLTIWLGVYFQA